jgi:uncharacterized membrane protein
MPLWAQIAIPAYVLTAIGYSLYLTAYALTAIDYSPHLTNIARSELIGVYLVIFIAAILWSIVAIHFVYTRLRPDDEDEDEDEDEDVPPSTSPTP